MTIFFYKRLTRNPEIENNPVWVLPNIWRLGRVMDTKFGTNVSNRMLLNAAKFQSCSFYFFWVIKGKPTGGQKSLPPPPRLGLIKTLFLILIPRIFMKTSYHIYKFRTLMDLILLIRKWKLIGNHSGTSLTLLFIQTILLAKLENLSEKVFERKCFKLYFWLNFDNRKLWRSCQNPWRAIC